MNRTKIIFVCHCVLNTASKVKYHTVQPVTEEDTARRNFLTYCVEHEIQIIQFPCPEFTLYGAERWGHSREQFETPHFRKNCRMMLEPYIDQMQEYVRHTDRFEVLGIAGINGSPSCGVDYSFSGAYGGELSSCADIPSLLERGRCCNKNGVFIAMLSEMLKEAQLNLPIISLEAWNFSKG